MNVSYLVFVSLTLLTRRERLIARVRTRTYARVKEEGRIQETDSRILSSEDRTTTHELEPLGNDHESMVGIRAKNNDEKEKGLEDECA